MPPDLRKVLAANPKAHAQWKSLTPIGQRDFISWLDSAKQSVTRTRRVESIPSRLASGKRRPCCYAIVPMNLYKTLGELPRAKVQWSDLTPDEKRDFVNWINEGKDTDARSKRIEKTCAMLLAKKRHP